MSNIFQELYNRFLFSRISAEEFIKMKDYINKASEEDLSDLMQEAWNSNVFMLKMNSKTKDQIKTRLSFCIESDNRNLKKKLVSMWSRIAVAVILLLVVGSSVWFLTDRKELKQEQVLVEAPRGDKAQVILPDGSKVRLNSESVITYDFTNKRYRNLTLKGEAFFEIHKDERRPFIVKANDIDIEVLGTTFNVRAYDNENEITSSLIEGSVKLTDNVLEKSYYLKPSQKAVYSKSTREIQIIPTTNEDETAWLEGKLIFNSERLCDVIEKMERWYDVNIDLQCPEIREDRISGSFKNGQVYFALEALRMQYKFKYTIKNNHTIIITK